METPNPNQTTDRHSNSSWQADTQDRAAGLADDARQAAQQRVSSEAEHTMQAASRAVSDSATALDRAAETLNEQGQQTLAQTTSSIASGLSDFARRLEGRSADDLMQDIAGLARRNPEMFVLGGIGAGLVLSRFLKASSSAAGRRH